MNLPDEFPMTHNLGELLEARFTIERALSRSRGVIASSRSNPEAIAIEELARAVRRQNEVLSDTLAALHDRKIL